MTILWIQIDDKIKINEILIEKIKKKNHLLD